MSELVVAFVLCACSVIGVVSHARALVGSTSRSRELDRLLGAIERACADFLWHETRLLALLLFVIGLAVGLPMALWHLPPEGRNARLVIGALGLLAGGGAGAAVARLANWASARATARGLAELRETPDALGAAVFRGGLVAALSVDALSSLVPCACFFAHYQYLTRVLQLDASAALAEAARGAPLVALGAICAAVIFQVGGGSFRTAASAAGSSARARDRRIALDDEQNPALVAELVGQRVGGVVLRSTDGFAALLLANATTIALAGAVARANPAASPGALALLGLPLLVRASGLLGAAIALGSLRFEAGLTPARAFAAVGASQAVIAATGLLGASLWLLGPPLYLPGFGAGVLGILGSLVCQGLLLAPNGLWPRLWPGDAGFEPGTSMARALGLGLQRGWAPLLVAGACLGSAFALGSRTPLEHGGAYLLLLAVAGMSSSGALHLCSSAFASIGSHVRRIGALRRGHYALPARSRAAELEQSALAIGNLGAIQGILAGTAAALLGAVTLPLQGAAGAMVVSLGHPIVILGAVLGISSLSFFVGGVLKNSSRAASALDAELGGELRSEAQQDRPEPAAEPEARSLPSYRGSVQRAASASTDALLPLAAAALCPPIACGVLLRLVYGPGGGSFAAQGLMALAAISVLTGGSAALAAQGALMALGVARPRPDSAPSQAPAGAESAREFMGYSVGPAALLGLEASVVSALAIAPLLFPHPS